LFKEGGKTRKCHGKEKPRGIVRNGRHIGQGNRRRRKNDQRHELEKMGGEVILKSRTLESSPGFTGEDPRGASSTTSSKSENAWGASRNNGK